MLALILSLAAAPQGCQAYTTDLMAGQHHKAGTVTITNTGDTLRVDVAVSPGAAMHHHGTIWAVHIYAGFGPPPGSASGNVSPGQFPYKTDYPNGTTSHTELIPLSDFGAQCDDIIQVAVHADVSCDLHGMQTAWAMGQNTFGGSQWGWWIDYAICCSSNLQSGLDLDVPALVVGGAAVFTVTGAQPGELVTLYRSGKPIVMGSGYTTGAFGATVLDIQAPVRVVGSSAADVVGVASISRTIPAHAPVGRVFAFQAVVLRNPDAAASDPAYGVIQ